MADEENISETTAGEREKEESSAPDKTAPAASAPPDYLGPYPVCLGENAKSYEQLRVGLVDFYAPSDPIENMYVRDMADADWQLQRVNRAKANCISAIQIKAVEQVLLTLNGKMVSATRHSFNRVLGVETDGWDPNELAYYYVHQEEWARLAVAKALQKVGLTEDVFIAQAMVMRSAELERMDRSALWHQAAREQALANLCRHRENKAVMCTPAPQIEDAEFRVIEDSSDQASENSSQQAKLAA